jgi:regulator of RNase E activity RraA
MSGSTVSRSELDVPVTCGGVPARPGDVVFGDDDGVVIASADLIARALETAEAIARSERALLEAMARGEALHDLTTYGEHVAALDAGSESRLAFRV